MQARFVRRSDLRPMRMSGVVGQKWRTSGYHYVLKLGGFPSKIKNRMLTLSITFSKEFGQSMAKQTKRRSVSG